MNIDHALIRLTKNDVTDAPDPNWIFDDFKWNLRNADINFCVPMPNVFVKAESDGIIIKHTMFYFFICVCVCDCKRNRETAIMSLGISEPFAFLLGPL